MFHKKHKKDDREVQKGGLPPLAYYDNPIQYNIRRKAVKIQKRLSDIEVKQSKENQSFFLKHPKLSERIWYTGHISILISSFLSVIFCLTRQVLKPWPRLFYRFTFVQIVGVYTLSLHHFLNGSRPGFFALLPLDTFQYILAAAFAVFTVPHTIKLSTFLVMSLLHVVDTHSMHHSNVAYLKTFSTYLSEKVAPNVITINAYLFLWLVVELAWDCLLIRPGAVVALIFYSFLFQVRMQCSPTTREAVFTIYKFIDDRIVERGDAPPKIRNLWIRMRNKFGFKDLEESDLYAKDTEEAIDKANLLGVLSF